MVTPARTPDVSPVSMTARLALCNEVLAPMDFAAQCAYAAALGYTALEVAPFTLADDPAHIDDTRAAALRRIAADHGLAICGLHWLLVAPKGLSITTPDDALRTRTVGTMRRLVTLCAALGGDYLVHGSPAQRAPAAGQTHADALARATDSWARAGEAAAGAGVTYCIEPLSADQTPIVNTVAEAAAIVRAVGVPALRTMLDTSSGGLAEAEPLAALIERWWPTGLLAHVQLNDRNRRAPGQGDDAFAPILAALERAGHRGWIAVEPFDYRPDGPGCAAFAIGYLRGLIDAGGH
jgi:D-psicose/D-tagatose/L-ribulose 3-epimerase